MLYTFKAKDGETIDLLFPMAKVPSIGKTVEVKGKTYTRIFCGVIAGGIIAMRSKYPYISHSLPPMATHGVDTINVNRGKGRGKAKVVIKSRKHEEVVMAKNDLVRY